MIGCVSLSAAAPALRTPLSYPSPFAMMSHHEMNGSLTSPGVYAGLHISPQMSAAAVAAYGRSPMVSICVYLCKKHLQCRGAEKNIYRCIMILDFSRSIHSWIFELIVFNFKSL